MFGRKGRRIAELEAQLAEADEYAGRLDERRRRTVAQRRDVERKLRGLKRAHSEQLRNLRKQTLTGRQWEVVRLAVAGLLDDATGTVHDGNHLEGCQRCDVYRLLGGYLTRPWHHAIRDHAAERVTRR